MTRYYVAQNNLLLVVLCLCTITSIVLYIQKICKFYFKPNDDSFSYLLGFYGVVPSPWAGTSLLNGSACTGSAGLRPCATTGSELIVSWRTSLRRSCDISLTDFINMIINIDTISMYMYVHYCPEYLFILRSPDKKIL